MDEVEDNSREEIEEEIADLEIDIETYMEGIADIEANIANVRATIAKLKAELERRESEWGHNLNPSR